MFCLFVFHVSFLLLFAEVIGALISVLTIWIVTGVLVYLAIKRLITNQFRVEGKNMLVTAGLAVGFNIL